MQTSYQEELNVAMAVARRLEAMCAKKLRGSPRLRPSLPGSSRMPPVIPPLSLPIPEDILPSLLDTGCPFSIASSLSGAFAQRFHQHRASFQAIYSRNCSQIVNHTSSNTHHSSSRLERLARILETKYNDQLSAARQEMLKLAQTNRTKPVKAVKATFNQEFIPLLEKYFEYNAYPSALDRVALARKSMMTARQIEVWFQNHRNRAKKEGKSLRRLRNDPLPRKHSLESLEQRMPLFIIPEKDRESGGKLPSQFLKICEEDRSGKLPNRLPNENLAFSTVSPPHAYPTIFPPSCDYDPFPVKNGGLAFATPVWMRKPACSLSYNNLTNFDDFVSDFAIKLTIQDSKNHPQHNSVLDTNIRPWFSATHTIVSRAPHAAFIQQPATIPMTQVFSTHLRTLPAPSSHLRPFKSPSPDSEPKRSHIWAMSDAPVARKIVCLPRCAPKQSSLAHRSTSPAISDAPSPSSLRSLSLSSRVSSFSSDASYDSHSPSSGSSMMSSTVTTPDSTPIPLPENGHAPLFPGMKMRKDIFNNESCSIPHTPTIQHLPIKS